MPTRDMHRPVSFLRSVAWLHTQDWVDVMVLESTDIFLIVSRSSFQSLYPQSLVVISQELVVDMLSPVQLPMTTPNNHARLDYFLVYES